MAPVFTSEGPSLPSQQFFGLKFVVEIPWVMVRNPIDFEQNRSTPGGSIFVYDSIGHVWAHSKAHLMGVNIQQKLWGCDHSPRCSAVADIGVKV